MAITITNSPNDYQNMFNGMKLSVSSTNTGQPNFMFLFDVFIVGTASAVARLTYPKQPAVTSVSADIASVLRGYATPSFSAITALEDDTTRSVVQYYVQIGEIYDVATVPTTFGNLAQFGTAVAHKHASYAVFDFLEWSKVAFTNMASASGSPKHLNQKLAKTYIRYGQEAILSVYEPALVANSILVTVFGHDGLVIDQGANFVSATNAIRHHNVGTSLLSSLGFDAYMQDESTAYYRVRLLEGANVLAENLYYIDACQDLYGTQQLQWFSSLGSWDSFNFSLANTISSQIERSQFKKRFDLRGSVLQRLKTTYSTTEVRQVKITSPVLNDDEWKALRELLLSPLVYVHDPSHGYVPVNLIESNYDEHKWLNGRNPKAMEITFEYTFNNYRQTL